MHLQRVALILFLGQILLHTGEVASNATLRLESTNIVDFLISASLALGLSVVLAHFGARLWLALVLVGAGAAITMAAIVPEESVLYGSRLALRVSVATFLPGVLVLLSGSVPAGPRLWLIALVLLSGFLSRLAWFGIREFSGALAGGLGSSQAVGAMVLNAALLLVVGVWTLFALPRSPAASAKLTNTASGTGERRLGGENGSPTSVSTLKQKIIALVFVYFCLSFGTVAVSWFLVSAGKALPHSTTLVAQCATVVFLWAVSRHLWIVPAFSMACVILGLAVGASLAGSSSPLIVFIVVATVLASKALFWSAASGLGTGGVAAFSYTLLSVVIDFVAKYSFNRFRVGTDPGVYGSSAPVFLAAAAVAIWFLSDRARGAEQSMLGSDTDPFSIRPRPPREANALVVKDASALEVALRQWRQGRMGQK